MNILYIGNDLILERTLISRIDQEKSGYYSLRSSYAALDILIQQKIEVLFVDESLFEEKQEIIDFYKRVVEVAPSLVVIFLCDPVSPIPNALKKRNFYSFFLNKKKVSQFQVEFILEVFQKKPYRMVVQKDLDTYNKAPCDLYIYRGLANSFTLLYRKDEELKGRKYDHLLNNPNERIYAKEHDFNELINQDGLPISDKLSYIRLQYKTLLTLLFDDFGKIQKGRMVLKKASRLISLIEKLTHSFPDIRQAALFLSYQKWSRVAHGINTAIYALIFSRHIGIASGREIALAGLFHDIGLAYTPRIKNKTLIQELEHEQHIQNCFDLLESKKIILNQIGQEVILHHHENYDGTGYPQGLHGKQIPTHSSLFCILDSIDHLRQCREFQKIKSFVQLEECLKRLQYKSPTEQKFNPFLFDFIIHFLFTNEEKEKKAA